MTEAKPFSTFVIPAKCLVSADWQEREQNRLVGRPLPRRAVGSTLLLKGLEAEVAVILNAGALDARNLYVAMTRGSKALTICAPSPILSPGLGAHKLFIGL